MPLCFGVLMVLFRVCDLVFSVSGFSAVKRVLSGRLHASTGVSRVTALGCCRRHFELHRQFTNKDQGLLGPTVDSRSRASRA